MSMTSKVSAYLRDAILKFLATHPYSAFNTEIQAATGYVYSLRAIQEATQKLAREGVLVRVGTAYRLASTNTANGNTNVATASK